MTVPITRSSPRHVHRADRPRLHAKALHCPQLLGRTVLVVAVVAPPAIGVAGDQRGRLACELALGTIALHEPEHVLGAVEVDGGLEEEARSFERRAERDEHRIYGERELRARRARDDRRHARARARERHPHTTKELRLERTRDDDLVRRTGPSAVEEHLLDPALAAVGAEHEPRVAFANGHRRDQAALVEVDF
jgi:hypothetical protein